MSHLSRIPVRERVRSFTALELGQAVFAYLCSEMYLARYIIATGREDSALSFEGALNLLPWLRYMLATMFSLSDRECEEVVSYTAIVTRDDQGVPDYAESDLRLPDHPVGEPLRVPTPSAASVSIKIFANPTQPPCPPVAGTDHPTAGGCDMGSHPQADLKEVYFMATKDKTTGPDKETLRHRLTLLVVNTLRTDAEEAKRAWERYRAVAEQETNSDEKQDLLTEAAYYRGRYDTLQGAAALVEGNLL